MSFVSLHMRIGNSIRSDKVYSKIGKLCGSLLYVALHMYIHTLKDLLSIDCIDKLGYKDITIKGA